MGQYARCKRARVLVGESVKDSRERNLEEADQAIAVGAAEDHRGNHRGLHDRAMETLGQALQLPPTPLCSIRRYPCVSAAALRKRNIAQTIRRSQVSKVPVHDRRVMVPDRVQAQAPIRPPILESHLNFGCRRGLRRKRMNGFEPSTFTLATCANGLRNLLHRSKLRHSKWTRAANMQQETHCTSSASAPSQWGSGRPIQTMREQSERRDAC